MAALTFKMFTNSPCPASHLPAAVIYLTHHASHCGQAYMTTATAFVAGNFAMHAYIAGTLTMQLNFGTDLF